MYNNVSEELKEIVTERNVLSSGARLTFKQDLDTIQIYGRTEQQGTPTPTSPIDIETLCAYNIFSSELENGWIDAQGNPSSAAGANSWRTKDFIPISPLTLYRLIRATTRTTQNYIYYYNSNKQFISRVQINSYNFTFTSVANAKYIKWRLSDTDTIFPEFIQLSKGNTDYSYLPFGIMEVKRIGNLTTETKEIDLKGNDVLDDEALVIDNLGNVYIEKRWGKLVLNGSENWQNFASYSDRTKATVSCSSLGIPEYVEAISNHYVFNGTASSGNNPYGKFSINNTLNLTFEASINSIEKIKQWLANNNVVIYYQLENIEYVVLDNIIPFKIDIGENDFSVLASIEPSKIEANYLNEPLTITNSELETLNYQDDCYIDGNILGNNIAKDLEVTIINKNQYDLENREFLLEFGILLDNNEYEYVPMGNFIIDNAEDLKSSYKFKLKAMDYLVKFNTPFEDKNTYPMNLKEFRHSVCEFYGVDEVEQILANDSFVIEEQPYFENMTGRQVIKAIAQLNGCFARITRDNKLEYVPLNNDSENIETIKANKMNSKLEIDKEYGEVNVVVLSLGGGVTGENVTRRNEDSIALYGENIIEIQDNPFVNSEERRERAVDNLFNAIKGFKYTPTLFNYMGRFWLDAGDKLRVQDTTDLNVYHNSMLLKHHLQVPALRQSKMENEALTKVAVKNQYVSNVDRIIGRTELNVDKQNKRMNAIIEQLDEEGERIVSIEANLDGITQSVSSTSNSIASLNSTTSKLNDDITNVQTTLISEIEQLSSSVTTQITSINKTIDEGVSASSVVTTAGRFDENGLTISRSDSEFSANFNNVGMYVNKGETNMLTADKDGVVTENLTVRTYFTAGYHRTEGYINEMGEKRTGVFYVG